MFKHICDIDQGKSSMQKDRLAVIMYVYICLVLFLGGGGFCFLDLYMNLLERIG